MKLYFKLPYLLLGTVITLLAVVVLSVLAAYFYVAPALPDVETLREVKLQVPLRIYTRDGRLMAEFG
jgi:penicillin-binding protein 1A